MKIADNITKLIGNTPLVKINNTAKDCHATIVAKLESFNPLSSIKDRIALFMIEDAENKGIINKKTLIVEPTSGNTGIGLAYICAVKGYKLILTMPDTMSIERKKILEILGAEIILTPGIKGMNGAIKKAEEIIKDNPKSFMLQQFKNPANPEAHKKTTAKEIWNDTDGRVDIIVAGVGTGGTITGVGEELKNKNPDIKIIAVEPADSAVLSGGAPGFHKIQGIGAGFIPDVLNINIIDEIVRVKNKNAFEKMRLLAKNDGIFVGISSGAVMHASLEVAKSKKNKGKLVVAIFPDTGERYLS